MRVQRSLLDNPSLFVFIRWRRAFMAVTLGLVCSGAALATEEFDPSFWPMGLRLMAGAGISSSVYSSEEGRRDIGVGSYIKTDLSYFFSDRWAVEWSSGVKFHRADGYFIWDTLFTLGVRYRIERLPFSKSQSSYLRFFFGLAPTVLFFDGARPLEYEEQGVERLHFDGPVAGASIGTFRRLESGRVWFYEATFSVQKLEQEDGIRMDGEVPIVIIRHTRNDRSTIYSLYAAIGAIFF